MAQLSTKVDGGGYKQGSTFRIGTAVLGAFAAVCIILFLTACPNAAGGTGLGTGNPSSNSGGASEGGTGGGFVLNELQETVYDAIIQSLVSQLKATAMTKEDIVETINQMNEFFKQIGFIVTDKNPENGLALGTQEADIKNRFVPKKDTSALSPYAPIKSDPEGLWLVIPEFNTDTQEGLIMLAGKEAEKSFVHIGSITIISGKTKATITEISYGSWDGTHNIVGNKITIDGNSFDISALLNSIP